MPRLWTSTIETHRREVRDAVLETTAALVAEQGLLAVTMSRIAEGTGIGRATLYKYFPDVESILREWHRREVGRHIEHLTKVRDNSAPGDRLRPVLEAYALGLHEARDHRDSDVAAALHRDGHVADAEAELRTMIRDLVRDEIAEGAVRDDIDASELATYCVYALQAAISLPSKVAVRRLVDLTIDALRSDAD